MQTHDDRLATAAPEMLKALKKSAQRIQELADMVNRFSNRLGLGDKVRGDDWNESAREAIALAES